MDNEFSIWMDGAPFLDVVEDADFGAWLDGAPVVSVNGANVTFVLLSATIAGSTTVTVYMTGIVTFSADVIMYTTVFAEMLDAPVGFDLPDPPHAAPTDFQLGISSIPATATQFTRPFGIYNVAKQCIPTVCCDEADAQITGYKTDGDNGKRTVVAVAFFADRPAIGQKWTSVNAVNFGVSCRTGVTRKTMAAALAEERAEGAVWGTWSASRDAMPQSGSAGANIRRAGEGEGRGPIDPSTVYPVGAMGPPGNDIMPTYQSTVQYVSIQCIKPNDQFHYFTPAGRSMGLTQAAADAAALDVATTLAPLYKLCFDGTPPVAQVGVPYSWTPTQVGAVLAARAYSHSSVGALPPGLSLSGVLTANGYDITMSGTPTAAGTYTFVIVLNRAFCGPLEDPATGDIGVTRFEIVLEVL